MPRRLEPLDLVIHYLCSYPSTTCQSRHSHQRPVQVTKISVPASPARHRKLQKAFLCFFAERHPLARSASVLFEFVLQVWLDVFYAISQPRQAKSPQVDSREQVIAKLSFANIQEKIPVGSRY